MALEIQTRVLELVRATYGGRVLSSPDWLNRPGRKECGRRWPLVRRLYNELTDLELPDLMPPRERRSVDLVLQTRGQPPRIVEVDERQHFNRYRAMTLRSYPRSVTVGFDRRAWLAACDAKARLEGGGFGRPRPPLFPGEGGRHRQRAFRDPLTDVLLADRAQRTDGAPLPRVGAFGLRARAKLCAWTTPTPLNLFPVCSPSESRRGWAQYGY
jgi:hypothetical protein